MTTLFSRVLLFVYGFVVLTFFLLIVTNANAAITKEQALSQRPRQKDVEVDTPSAKELNECKLEQERVGEKGSGYVVIGQNGQVLRRLMDTNGDGTIDQIRFYLNGLEVYRDIDSNFNKKYDQARWFNTGGSRWGIDSNEDGRIDRWKVLSPQEASREAVHALVTRDVDAMSAILITEEDIQSLGIEVEPARKILARVGDLEERMKSATKSRVLSPTSRWSRFDSSMLMPITIPAEPGKVKEDLIVYENVMAMVDRDGDLQTTNEKDTGFVQIGELVRVGEVWKLTQVPQALEGDAPVLEGGVLMQPSLSTPDATATSLSPEVLKLVESLKELDNNQPNGTAKADELSKYNVQRARLLEQLAESAGTEQERSTWRKQMIDGISAAAQMGAFPSGLKRLSDLESEIRADSPNSELLPYVSYRRMYAEYYERLRTAGNDSTKAQKVQQWWQEELGTFATDFPAAEDAPGALLQLGVTQELLGKTKEAQASYDGVVAKYQESPEAKRAGGAIFRLKLVGRPLPLKGTSLDGDPVDLQKMNGKVVAVVIWTTNSPTFVQDLPKLLELYKDYRAKGFEVVGVNIDLPNGPVAKFIQDHKIPWANLSDPGYLDSKTAVAFGLISPPLIFVVDKSGKVVSNNATVPEVVADVPQLLGKR